MNGVVGMVLRRLHWTIGQAGFDPMVSARFLMRMPQFVVEFWRFRRDFVGAVRLKPCVHDYEAEGGSNRDEYFWQDLHVARRIYRANPQIHVDVGSRVDGFVAHVASYREIEVLDIRPIATQIPGVKFRRADLMEGGVALEGCCDSLSCLHALEHFGLGRYGDPIRIDGPELGIANLARMLKAGGTLYLSTPVGAERVEFNANWVFDPRKIVSMAEKSGLRLETVEIFSDTSIIAFETDLSALTELSQRDYTLAIFIFKKDARAV